jgi:hypothetical protein
MWSERARKAEAKYMAANGDKVRARQRVRAAVRREENPDNQRAIELRSTERRRHRLEKAAGRPRPDHCERCGELHRYICFDHDHKTGAFRGWLCDRCNKVLGLVYDDPRILRILADYLEAHHGEKPTN